MIGFINLFFQIPYMFFFMELFVLSLSGVVVMSPGSQPRWSGFDPDRVFLFFLILGYFVIVFVIAGLFRF